MAKLLLPDSNLYQRGTVVIRSDGSTLLQRKKLVYGATMSDEYYTVVEGDSLDKIAGAKYGNKIPDASKYWWLLADVNNIQNPLDIEYLIGVTILIPNIFNARLKL